MTLKDAIDTNHFYIESKSYKDADLQNMTIDELETLKMQINKKISGISASLKEKQIDQNSTGEIISKAWYMRRRNALSINQRVLTYINSLLRKRRRPERSVSDYFMEEAKTVMPPELYEEVLTNAHGRMGIQEGTA